MFKLKFYFRQEVKERYVSKTLEQQGKQEINTLKYRGTRLWDNRKAITDQNQ